MSSVDPTLRALILCWHELKMRPDYRGCHNPDCEDGRVRQYVTRDETTPCPVCHGAGRLVDRDSPEAAPRRKALEAALAAIKTHGVTNEQYHDLLLETNGFVG